MARRKQAPERSKITRVTTVAYARKQKPDGTDEPEAPEAAAAPHDKFDVTDRSQPLAIPVQPAAKPAPPPMPATPPAEPAKPVESAKPVEAAKPAPRTSGLATPAEVETRARTETLAMPVVAPIGTPPEMPSSAAPTAAARRTDVAEDPTHMPGPKDIPPGAPSDPAAPPGRVPPGDSRSMRRRDAASYEFALIYRQGTFVVTRFGQVGTRGQWRVVEYPTSASASHAYAKECSRFVSEGFSDYRD